MSVSDMNTNQVSPSILFCEGVNTVKKDFIPKSMDEIKDYLSVDRHIFEIIDKNDKVKLFLDIDLKYKKLSDGNYKGEDNISHTLQELLALRQTYLNKFKMDDWNIVDSSGKLWDDLREIKISFHLIHKTNGFKNMADHKIFMESKPYSYPGIDSKVYRRYGKMRAPNQTKCKTCNRDHPEDKRVLKILSQDKNVINYLLTTGVKNILEVKASPKPVKLRKKKINVKQIREIIDILPSEYYNVYDNWVKVGFSMNEYPELFNIWVYFSKKSKKFDMDAVSHQWTLSRKTYDNPIKIGSLFHWAKEENRALYSAIIKKYNGFENAKLKKRFMNSKTGMTFGDFIHKWNKEEIEDATEWFDDIKQVFGFVRNLQCYITKTPKGILMQKQMRELTMLYVTLNKKRTSFLNLLISMGMDSVMYSRIIFKPCKKFDQNVFNLWPGFRAQVQNQIEDVDMEMIEPILYHIKHVLANGDKEVYDYILQWLAHIVQKPQHKTETSLVFISKQGAGKNIFGTFLTKYLFGKDLCSTINDISAVTGRFNNIIDQKILLILDEVSSASGEYHSTFDKLKSIITETEQRIEKKGIDPITVNNYANLIFFSNHSYPVRIEQSDRRYMVSECSDTRIGDTKYFNKFAKCLNIECANEFMKYLSEISIEKYNFRKMLPKTEMKQTMILRSLTPDTLYLRSLYNEYSESTMVSTSELFSGYRDFCELNEHKKKYKSTISFGRFMSKNFSMKRVGKKRSTHYNIDPQTIQSKLYTDFNLDICDLQD